MMKKPLVYIIILNWNGYKDTIECVDSIKKSNYKNYKIVLVDNASHDDSVSILQSKFPDIKLLVNKENLGFAGGCNKGIHYVLQQKADYFLLLNNDTLVDPNFLTPLIEVAESKKDIGLVGPKIYYYGLSGKIWSAGGRFDFKNGPFFNIDQNMKDTPQNSLIKQVDYINGCCLLVKRNVVEKIGMFDEKYFAYVEDVDFNTRANKAGYVSYFVSTSRIWHKVSSSTGGEDSLLKNYYKSRNFIMYYKKNFPFIKNKLKYAYLGRIYFMDIAMSVKKRKIKKCVTIVKGLIEGLLL